MKLTWFGNSCFRLHAGGRIVVVDAGRAPAVIDRTELLGGADQAVETGGSDLRVAEPGEWKPRPAQRLLDAGEAVRMADVWVVGPEALLVDAEGEAPILLAGAALSGLGKWADRAVIVLHGSDLAHRGTAILENRTPRLLALAGSESEIDAAFAVLRGQLDGTGLLALEPGLAVEV